MKLKPSKFEGRKYRSDGYSPGYLAWRLLTLTKRSEAFPWKFDGRAWRASLRDGLDSSYEVALVGSIAYCVTYRAIVSACYCDLANVPEYYALLLEAILFGGTDE